MTENERKVTNHILRDFLEMVMIQFHLNDKTLDYRFDWRKNRTRSWGGVNNAGNMFISLAMLTEYRTWNCTSFFVEYDSYYDDKEIGSFKTDDILLYFKALVCHELSHCIAILKYNDASHGPIWRGYYRIMRNLYINPLLAE